MTKAQFKKLVKEEIIKRVFGRLPISEDMLQGDEDIVPSDDEEEPIPDPPETPKEPEEPQDTQEPPQSPDQSVTRLSRLEAIDVIMGTKGRIFTVLFVKKNGTDRLMNCRLGVTRYLTGRGLRWNPAERGYLPVFDLQKRDYRMMNFKTLKMIKVGNKTYDVA